MAPSLPSTDNTRFKGKWVLPHKAARLHPGLPEGHPRTGRGTELGSPPGSQGPLQPQIWGCGPLPPAFTRSAWPAGQH